MSDMTAPEKGTLTHGRISRAGVGSVTTNTASYEAKTTIVAMWVGGFFLMGVGIAIAVSSWPSEVVGYYGTTATGSEGGAIAGTVIAGIGQLMVLVGIIATGVRLGSVRD